MICIYPIIRNDVGTQIQHTWVTFPNTFSYRGLNNVEHYIYQLADNDSDVVVVTEYGPLNHIGSARFILPLQPKQKQMPD